MLDIVPESSWLYEEEQREVVKQLLRFKLIKFDNERGLPLKGGGKTDVYINLRDARNNPKALCFVTELFTHPLRRLGLDRFVEVPDSVSCFAGPLAMATDLPYTTIREQAKTGRVGDTRVIGKPSRGEVSAIVDDVITDGASKIIPIRTGESLGLQNRALVVLVDRQQGWQDRFAEAGIKTPVWAGMTLDDVRRHLIRMGVMQRCDPAVEEKNPLIVALDGRSWEEILTLIDPLRTTGCILKVNDLLTAKGAEWLMPRLSTYGRVLADLKLDDIGNTAMNHVQRLLECGHLPWGITVHASGNGEMVGKVVEKLKSTDVKVIAVTVLTSWSEEDCQAVYGRSVEEQVNRLAAIADGAGAHGFVSSAHEVARLKEQYPNLTVITPGIRSVGEDVRDQKRVATPEMAMKNGSDHLVIGGQILKAKHPVAEVRRIIEDELHLEDKLHLEIF